MGGEHILYTKLAKYYDVIYREYLKSVVPREIDAVEEVFRRFARRVVREVLDIACGTGGPTLELARRGYLVTGADLHEEVIELARVKAREAGLKVDFVVTDARGLSRVFPSDSFDAVTMFFSSINYMTSWGDLLKLLSEVKYVLREGGVFVADAPNPHDLMFRLGRGGGEGRAYTWDVEGAEEGEYVVLTDWKEVINWVDGVIRFKRLITIVRNNGRTESYLMSDTLRLHTAKELELAAKEADFKEVKVMCYSKGKLLNPSEGGTCGRLVLVAVK